MFAKSMPYFEIVSPLLDVSDLLHFISKGPG